MTLLELMVVVAILAILTGLSASALGPAVSRYRRTVAIEAVASALVLARVEARQQNRCYVVQVRAGGAAVPPGTPGDSVHVERRVDADCEAAAPPTAPDPRISDVLLPSGVQALVPGGSSVPEFRPNGYTQDGLDTEIHLGPAGAPDVRIAIRSFGPICTGSLTPLQPCP